MEAAFACEIAAVADVVGTVFADGAVPVMGILYVWGATLFAGD